MNIIEIGTLKKQPRGFSAFIPNPFPPKEGFAFSSAILLKNDEATRLIGKLDGVTKNLPDMENFLRMYMSKDAASSSQIEGTMATMTDAIEAKVQRTMKIPADVDDILHYLEALHHGIKRINEPGFFLSLNFIRELHRELMHNARVSGYLEPGEFREEQVWIGATLAEDASYVPPPVDEMRRALNDLERYINTDDSTTVIIKTGLIHAQFETIHPFKDGNGRTGRMLINFYLWQTHFLEKLVLFLSSYFNRNRRVYYDKLQGYHSGNVEEWVDYFLNGVIEIASESIDIVSQINALHGKDVAIIASMGKRAAESAVKVMPKLYTQPIVNVATIQKWTGFSRPGAQVVIDRFIEKGILIPKDRDLKYGQSYVYKQYLDIFKGKD